MQRPKPVSPLLSDPYFLMAVAPAMEVVSRMGQRMADVLLVEEDQHNPEFIQAVESSDLGVMVPGLSPVEVVTERYSMRVGGKPVVAVEVKTLLVDAKVYDLEVVCSWHPQVEVEMQALLKRMQVNMLALMLGLGMNLRPRMDQRPGLLVVHLGQSKTEMPGVVLHEAPFQPAEAATEGPGFVMYPGHHSDGYYDHPSQPVACPCDDDNPSWDGPSECRACENFALCHPSAASEPIPMGHEPIRKAA